MSEGSITPEITPNPVDATKPVETPPKSPEAEKRSLDAVLVFGQGPILDSSKRERAADVADQGAPEDINFWSKGLAEAAAELYKRGATREIIVMGGKTGGENYSSEAELITKAIEEQGVPASAIKREDRSTNTLENTVNVLNDYLDAEGQQIKDLGILTANYHLQRTRMLMEMFEINYKTAFSAEEVMRFAAMQGQDAGDWDHDKLLEIERRLNLNENIESLEKKPGKFAPGYFPQQQGAEQKNVVRRIQEERAFKRALQDMPEYWIMYLGRLNNAERIRQILLKQDQEILMDRFDISLADSDVDLKAKLLAVERKLPDLDTDIAQNWPEMPKSK
jgi:uncharacterized SAM-binding protein YcdF (DUF218 family)